MADSHTLVPSLEWQIDSQLEDLTGKMLRGDATDEDKIKYHELAALRAERMLPNEIAYMARVKALLGK